MSGGPRKNRYLCNMPSQIRTSVALSIKPSDLGAKMRNALLVSMYIEPLTKTLIAGFEKR
jgi:hypothetical protein